jgi:hypothetical protein
VISYSAACPLAVGLQQIGVPGMGVAMIMAWQGSCIQVMGAAKGSWYSLVVPAKVLIILMDFVTVHANSASWPPTFGTEIPIFTIVVPVWWETVRGFMERSIQWLVRMRCLRIVVVSCRINGKSWYKRW